MSKRFFKGFVVGYLAGAAGATLAFKIMRKKRGMLGRRLMAWKIQNDIERRLENLKKWSKSAYNESVDAALEKYRKMEWLAETELAALAADLKERWRESKQRFEESELDEGDEDEEDEK